ncbi:hypothetical protein QBC35DRAFT_179508 [Podospora australis]|uniref:Uncharacterized protein n=1 Tax=Podospora australis TaxID=1536484 RepID=A0AAN6WWL1_9PEZI|nr:hypothetical protein QBC35DRAFT_179508 [Podospora australis]
MSERPVIYYQVDSSQNPATWPGSSHPQPPESGFLDISKVDVLFININSESDFRTLRTGTNEHVQVALTQVMKHVARGLYRIVSLNASEYSCVVVMSTEKSWEDLMWKTGFPWDKDDDPQPQVVLK